MDQAARLRQLAESLSKQRKDNQAAPFPEGGTRVIAVTSGKGGVGKTNITVNLAIALSRAGLRTLIVDADIGMANVDVVLGTLSHKHLLNLLEQGSRLEDILMHGPYGINYISGGSGIEKAQDFSPSQRKILMEKLGGVSKLADVILVDTGAGLGKNVMDFILAADEVILVTTPEPTSLTDAYAVMKAYSMYAEEPDLRLVINRVYDERESREGAAKLSQTAERFLHLRIPCLGYVYEDRAVSAAVRHQIPFLIGAPSSVASRCILDMARVILYGGEMNVRRGWKGFLQHIFKFS